MSTPTPSPDDEMRAAREGRGLSLRAAETFLRASGVSVSERSLGAYERGTSTPDPTKRAAILDAYSDDAELPRNTPPRIPTEEAVQELRREAAARGDGAYTTPLPNAQLFPLLNIAIAGSTCARVSLLIETTNVQPVDLSLPNAA